MKCELTTPHPLTGNPFPHFLRVKAGILMAVLLMAGAVSAQTPDGFGPRPDGTVYAVLPESDGDVAFGGVFSLVGGAESENGGRVLDDGTVDRSFGPKFDNSVLCMAEQDDGKYLVGGHFTEINSTGRNRLARLSQTGALDFAFNPEVNDAVRAVALLPDGKILIAGSFTEVGGVTRNRLARLNADGSLDTSFNPGADASVYSLALQADGKIVIGGYFQNVGGVTRNRLARLEANGVVDPGFDPDCSGAVACVAVQPDGRIVVGGLFNEIAGVHTGPLARIEADGTRDTSFVVGADDWVRSIVLQADGKILVGGEFTQVYTSARNRVARLNADGSVDGSFDPDASFPVQGLALQADGKVLVGGEFGKIGGVYGSHRRLARLTNNIAASQALTVTGTSQVDWVRGGSAPEVEQVRFEVWQAGFFGYMGWSDLGAATRVAGGWQLTGLNLPASARVRARGRTRGGYSNGSTGLAEQVAAYGGWSPPTIEVSLEVEEDDGGWGGGTITYVPQANGATVDFGARRMGSSYSSTRIRITNTGSETIRNVRVGYQGAPAGEFGTTSSSSRNLSAGAYYDVFPNFRPKGGGPRADRLWITGDGFDSTPFELKLIGIGQISDSPYTYVADLNNAGVYGMVPQESGSALIGGSFTSDFYDTRNRLAKLDSSGDFDDRFDPDANGKVWCIAEQADGKILVGGEFTTVGGVARERIARLHPDGSLDTTFNPGANDVVYGLAIEPDGSILVVGRFTTIGGTARNRMARLNADGVVDPGYNPNVSGSIFSMVRQPDGRVVIGGSFTTSVGGVARSRIARIEEDGTPDATFDPGANGAVDCLALQADGKILMGGRFTGVAGYVNNRIARLNPDGSLDFDFDCDLNESVFSMVLQANGKILIGGGFSSVNGTARQRLALLHPNGDLDPDYDAAENTFMRSLALQGDGKLLACGNYVEDAIGGGYWPVVVRYANLDGGSEGFSPGGTGEVQWLRDGGLPLVQDVEFDVWDGAAWVPVGPGTRIPGGWMAAGAGVPASGWVRARGRTYGGANSSSSGPYVRIGTFGDAIPDIALEGPTGNNLSDGGGAVSMGTVAVSTTGSAQIFTIRNDGTGILEGLSLGIDGEHLSDFVLGSLGATALNPGETTSFTVTFTPGGIGSRHATVRINSSDYDEATFDVALTGAGLGDLDPFDPDVAGTVNTMVTLDDGRVLIGGSFSSVGGVGRAYLALLNADGTLVADFDPQVASTVNCAAVQVDGKIVIGGSFSSVGGVARSRLARLNPDGTLDLSFDPNVSSTVYCLAIQADERILVGGSFSTVGGTARNYMARIDANGALDAGFNPDPNSFVLSIAVQGDGKILLGGYFYTVGGVDRFGVARVQASGALDGSFFAAVEEFDDVYCVVVQPDGKILMGGSFDFLSSPVRSNLVRLESDGSLDSGFDPGSIGLVRSMALQADGSILVGGDFTSVGGVVRHRVARLGGDGSLDPTWNPGANSSVYSVGLTAQGDILLGGNFTNVGGWPRNRAARVANNVAPVDQLAATGSSQVDWQRGGGVPETDRAFFDLWDGSQWASLGAATRVAGGWQMTGLSLPAGGWLRARGLTRGGYYSGSPGWVSAISSFGSGSVPEITVEDQAGNPLEYGFALHDFGSQDWLTTGPTTSFTIRNDGTADLTGLTLSVDGADYAVSALGVSTLAPGASATFTASFAPQAAGLRVGTVRIESNDFDESVFEVRLIGVGVQALPGFEDTIGGTVYTAIVLEDGSVIVGGDFTTVGGKSRQRLARFLPDGSLDPGFAPNVNSRIYALAEQRDGKILIVGDFSQVNGINRYRIARLNADGTLDYGFDPNVNSSVYAMALQADGRILIAGGFSTVGGVSSPRLARLEVDGSLDASFAPNPNGYVYTLAVQPDGKILAGGQFGSIGGQTRNRIARLETDGTADAFDPDANSYVYSVALVADGAILLGGDFTTIGGIARERIARVSADGTLDATFDPGANGRVNSFAVQADGSVLVGGSFLQLGGENRNRIGRLFADGTPDPLFQPNANSTVHGVILRADGSVLVAGSFSKIGGADRSGLALLGNDVAPAGSFIVTGTNQIDWMRGGSAPVLGSVIMESWDGAGWVAHPVAKVAGGWQASGLSLPASGWVRGRGRAQGGYYNGSSSVVRQMAAYGTTWPDITVEDDGGGDVQSGAFELDFGTQDYQVPTASVYLTIRNGGTADLSGLVVESSMADFVVVSPVVTVLAPGASTTFSVTFSPRLGGVREGVLRILSNDADETPFLINLTGQGSNTSASYGSAPLATLSDPSTPGTPGNRFGESVAVSGDLVVAGAPGDDTGGSDAGRAHVFDMGSSTPGLPVLTLAPPVPGVGNEFGSAVAVFGDWIAVGARRDETGATDAGAVHVFDRSSGTPAVPVHTLLHPTPQNSQEFGTALALDGDLLVVGAPLDGSLGYQAGQCFVYDLGSATPTVPVAILPNPEPTSSDRFGSAVAVSGNRIAVGVSLDDHLLGNSGSVYVFDLSSGTPTLPVDSLRNPTPASSDQFGNDVALSGSLLLVGAMMDDSTASNAGRAYVFDLDASDPGVPTVVLENPDPATSDFFGEAVALSGGLAVVGAYADDHGASDAGSVYLFDLFSATPSTPLQQLGKVSPGAADHFGQAVAVDGSRIVSGIPRDDTFGTDQGAVQVHGLSGLRPEIVLEDGGGADLASGSGILDFGALAPGATSELSVTVKNTGAAPLTGLASQIVGMDAAHFVVVSPPTTPVAPGGMTSLTVRFTAPPSPDPRQVDAVLRLFTNDGDESVFTLMLTGEILLPDIVVENDAGVELTSGSAVISLGQIELFESSPTVTVTIRNDGNSPLTGLALLIDSGDVSGFQIETGGMLTELPPGADATFGVAFHPEMPGTRTVTIHLVSNDPDENPFEVQLTGEGIVPEWIAPIAYLKASNAGANDFFGEAVAMDGDTVVVGAPYEDGISNGQGEAGAAYVYVRNGGTWVEEAVLRAEFYDAGSRFGETVAISGETIVVGAFLEDRGASGVNGTASGNGLSDSGAAYVFTRSAGVWTQQAYLKASNSGAIDRFGSSVGVDGDVVVVGASGEGSAATQINGDQLDNSAPYAGAAYVFVRSGEEWTEVVYLKAANAEGSDRFGQSVAVSGTTIVVGSSEHGGVPGVNGDSSDNTVDNAGAVYVFVGNGGSWTQQAYLKASEVGASDYFGKSIDIFDDLIVVGAYREDSNAVGINGDDSDNSSVNSGAGYVFVRNGGIWTQEAYLKASNADPIDEFGFSVAVSGETVVIGAFKESGNGRDLDENETDNSAYYAGAAYVFERIGGIWSQRSYVKAMNSERVDLFGWSVALSDDSLVVGARLEEGGSSVVNGDPDDNSLAGAGAAYIFDLRSTSYEPEIVIEDETATRLIDGISQIDFGDIPVGTTSLPLTLTIRNIGYADLTGLEVAVEGPQGVAISVDASGLVSSLRFGESADVVVRFTASASGPMSATLRVASGDANENPFTIDLIGNGVLVPPGSGASGEPFDYGNGSNLDTLAGGAGWGGAWSVPAATGEWIVDFGRANYNDNGYGSAVYASRPLPAPMTAGNASVVVVKFDFVTEGLVSDEQGLGLDLRNGGVRVLTLGMLSDDGLAIFGKGVETEDDNPPLSSGMIERSELEFVNWTITTTFAFDGADTHVTLSNGIQELVATLVGQQVTFDSIALGGYGEESFGNGIDNIEVFEVNISSSILVVEEPVGTPLADGESRDFGSVDLDGGLASRTFTLRNDGDADLVVGVPEITGVDAGDFVIASLPGSPLSPGGSTTMTVTFDPTVPGSRAAQLGFTTSDPAHGAFTVDLTGTATAIRPEIVVEQPVGIDLASGAATIDFGTVATGGNTSLSFTIRNTGTADLTGIGVGPSGGNQGDFIVTAAPDASVIPGGTTSLVVTFAPGAGGVRTTSLQIVSNDADETPFTITLTGQGATAAVVLDSEIAAAGLTEDDALPLATPFNDGVPNLLKYAFNMNLAGPDSSSMATGGSSGLPGGGLAEVDGQTVWQVEFVRRKGSGLVYTPKRSATLNPGSFVPMTGAVTVNDIDGEWERVTVNEPCDPSTVPSCFSHVEVTMP